MHSRIAWPTSYFAACFKVLSKVYIDKPLCKLFFNLTAILAYKFYRYDDTISTINLIKQRWNKLVQITHNSYLKNIIILFSSSNSPVCEIIYLAH